MKQELYIKGEVVSYTLLVKHITAVLGKAYIYKVPTPEDVLRIVYRGLMRTCGLALATSNLVLLCHECHVEVHRKTVPRGEN